MSIVRVEHSKENPYVVLNKKALEDKSISWAAKGLWSYLLSRPDNWKVSVTQLSSIYNGKGGKEKAIYSLLKELIAQGYCAKEIKRADKGHYEKVEYVIYELKISLPLASQGDAGKRNAGKRHLNKQGVLLSTEKQQTQKVANAPVVVPSDEEEKAKKDSELAANQYIEAEKEKGNSVNEIRIRRRALKEAWKSNAVKVTKKDLTSKFEDGIFYEGVGKQQFECTQNKEGIGFIHPTGHLYFIEWKDPNFSKGFDQIIKKLGVKS